MEKQRVPLDKVASLRREPANETFLPFDGNSSCSYDTESTPGKRKEPEEQRTAEIAISGTAQVAGHRVFKQAPRSPEFRAQSKVEVEEGRSYK